MERQTLPPIRNDLPNGICLEHTHPLIAHKMTIIRKQETTSNEFRRLLKEVTFYLGYEATRGLNLTEQDVVTPMQMTYHGHKISDRIAVVPILRGGLGMVEAMLDLLPNAAVHHIGMYKAKNSTLPVQYYNRLPRDTACDVAFVCDVNIATATTALAVISILKKWGAKKIILVAVIGSDSGVSKIVANHPDVSIVVGTIDKDLSPDGYALPGIGDAGDRLFGTPLDDDTKNFLSKNTLLQNESIQDGARKRSRSIDESESNHDIEE